MLDTRCRLVPSHSLLLIAGTTLMTLACPSAAGWLCTWHVFHRRGSGPRLALLDLLAMQMMFLKLSTVCSEFPRCRGDACCRLP